MNENLPEINFKEKKEKKGGGPLGWLRSRLGIGSRGAIGEAGINPSVMNVGRALGTAKFGASAGFGGFLAGNIGTIATVVMVAVAGGLYLANNSSVPAPASGAFTADGKQDNYVPAILRSQAANQGSSLEMFKDTNKGAGLAMETDPNAAANKAAAEKAAADKAAAEEANKNAEQPPGGGDMAQDMMAKLQGGSMGSLSTSLGGSSSKFSGLGGFGNKFNSGAIGQKTGFTSGIGTGFGGLPNTDARKSKMLAMKGSSRPVFSSSKAGKKGVIGPGAFGQAKGLRATQKSYTGAGSDPLRSTQDQAWEGTTADGSTGGAGLGAGTGGAGVMSSPSLDNAGGGAGGGATPVVPTEPVIPPVTAPTNVSPWAGLVQKAMMYLMISAMLSAIASAIPSGYPWGILKIIIGGIALAMGLMALMAGIQVMSSHGQALLGTIYVIGGGVAMAAAAMSMMSSTPPVSPLVLAAVAGVIGLIGSMLGGK